MNVDVNYKTSSLSSTPQNTKIHVLQNLGNDIYKVKIGQSVIDIRSASPLQVGSSFIAPVILDKGRLLIYMSQSQVPTNSALSFFEKNTIPQDALSVSLVEYILSSGGTLFPEKIKKALIMGKFFTKDFSLNKQKRILQKTYELLSKGILPEEWEIEELLNLEFFDLEEECGQEKQRKKDTPYVKSPKENKHQPSTEETSENFEKTESFLQVFNHLTDKNLQKIIVPFELQDANIKGCLHFLVEPHTKKSIKTDIFAKTKTERLWHFNFFGESKKLNVLSFPALNEQQKTLAIDFFNKENFFSEIEFIEYDDLDTATIEKKLNGIVAYKDDANSSLHSESKLKHTDILA